MIPLKKSPRQHVPSPAPNVSYNSNYVIGMLGDSSYVVDW